MGGALLVLVMLLSQLSAFQLLANLHPMQPLDLQACEEGEGKESKEEGEQGAIACREPSLANFGRGTDFPPRFPFFTATMEGDCA